MLQGDIGTPGNAGGSLEQQLHENKSLKGQIETLLEEDRQQGLEIQKQNLEIGKQRDEMDQLKLRLEQLLSRQDHLEQKVTLHDQVIDEYELRMECMENATHNGKLLWKISNFSIHRDRARAGATTALLSQPFYTGENGYQMCAKLYPNGHRNGEDTHISLYFVIMRGTYDGLLSWPFNHQVILGVKDLNGGGPQSDIRYIVPSTPEANAKSFQKPVTENNAMVGFPQFLSLDNLDSYIREDTIYIFADVDVSTLEINAGLK